MSRGAALVGRPWFWGLLIGGLWIVPLLKSLGAKLPDPLPGGEGPPLELTLPAEDGRDLSLADLGGQLVVLRALPLADPDAGRSALDRLHELRKRLKGLDPSVAFVLVSSGADRPTLTALLDERVVRKPLHVFLHDASDGAWSELLAAVPTSIAAARGEPIESLLLDRHGRVRGAYGAGPDEVARLARDAGVLANWSASDGPLAPAIGGERE